jgi:hypothetical protein
VGVSDCLYPRVRRTTPDKCRHGKRADLLYGTLVRAKLFFSTFVHVHFFLANDDGYVRQIVSHGFPRKVLMVACFFERHMST